MLIDLPPWAVALGVLLGIALALLVLRRVRTALAQVRAATQGAGESIGWARLLDASSGRPSGSAGRFVRQGLELRFERGGNAAAGDLAWPLSGLQVRYFPSDPFALGLPDVVRLADGKGACLFVGSSPSGLLLPQATRRLLEGLREALPAGHVRFEPGEDARRTRALAAVLLLLVTAGAGALAYARMQQGGVVGVQVMTAAADGSVYAATDGDLLRFSSAGALERRWSWRELGLRDGVSDLAALPDGRLLLGDSARGVIRRCDLAAPACADLPAFDAPERAFKRAFRFVFDAGTGAIFASDTARHRMLRIDADGRWQVLDEAAARGLCFPNRAALGHDGRLLLADTNNFRVLEWSQAARWPEGGVAEHPVVAATPGSYGCRARDRSQRGGDATLDRLRDFRAEGRAAALAGLGAGSVWVSELAQGPDRRWWLLLNGSNMRRGDVAIVSPDWRTHTRVALPPGTDPWTFVLRADDALVSDPVTGAIHRFGLDGSPRPAFAAAALEQYVAPLRAAQATWGRIALGLGVALAAAVGALLLIGRVRRRARLRAWLAPPEALA